MEKKYDYKVRDNINIIIVSNMLSGRSVAIIPSVIVAFIFGESGSDELIVLSQVVLSIQLPFCLIPLVKITNNEKRMGRFRNGLAVSTNLTQDPLP